MRTRSQRSGRAASILMLLMTLSCIGILICDLLGVFQPTSTPSRLGWEPSLVACALAVTATCSFWVGLLGTAQAPAARSHARQHQGLFAKREHILRTLLESPDVLLDNSRQLLTRHFMTDRLLSVPPEASAEEVRETMARQRTRHLLVCRDSALLGVISDRDLRKPGASAALLMSGRPVVIGPDVPVQQALTKLIKHRISCLPVQQEGVLMGVVTSSNLLAGLECCLTMFELLDAED